MDIEDDVGGPMAGGGGTFLGRREPTGGRAAIRGSTGRVAARGGRRGATAAGTGAKTTLRGEGIRSEYEATGEQGHSSFEAMDGSTVLQQVPFAVDWISTTMPRCWEL
mmetsp:Transcript_11399/g.24669  ORF Transcript_11399/g.24669 Transcript_11399/m.24669 type:complete len:108 (+) Transcript_11399:470-793(+)